MRIFRRKPADPVETARKLAATNEWATALDRIKQRDQELTELDEELEGRS